MLPTSASVIAVPAVVAVRFHRAAAASARLASISSRATIERNDAITSARAASVSRPRDAVSLPTIASSRCTSSSRSASAVRRSSTKIRLTSAGAASGLHVLEHAGLELHHEPYAFDGGRDAETGVMEHRPEHDQRDDGADREDADETEQDGEDGPELHVFLLGRSKAA